jgi:hypothetical protein
LKAGRKADNLELTKTTFAKSNGTKSELNVAEYSEEGYD